MILIPRPPSSDFIKKDSKCLFFLCRLAVLTVAMVDYRANVGGMGWSVCVPSPTHGCVIGDGGT